MCLQYNNVEYKHFVHALVLFCLHIVLCIAIVVLQTQFIIQFIIQFICVCSFLMKAQMNCIVFSLAITIHDIIHEFYSFSYANSCDVMR